MSKSAKPTQLNKKFFIKYLILLFIGVLGLVFVPKKLVTEQLVTKLVVRNACTDEESIKYISYKVYATESVYNKNVEKDNAEVAKAYYQNNYVLLTKESGEESTSYKTNYVKTFSNEVPPLNVEYYIVTNCDFFGNVLPVKTIISLAKTYGDKINTYYKITVYSILGLYTFIVGLIFGLKLSKRLKEKNDEKN